MVSLVSWGECRSDCEPAECFCFLFRTLLSVWRLKISAFWIISFTEEHSGLFKSVHSRWDLSHWQSEQTHSWGSTFCPHSLPKVFSPVTSTLQPHNLPLSIKNVLFPSCFQLIYSVLSCSLVLYSPISYFLLLLIWLWHTDFSPKQLLPPPVLLLYILHSLFPLLFGLPHLPFGDFLMPVAGFQGSVEMPGHDFAFPASHITRPVLADVVFQAGDCLKDRETTWSVAMRQGFSVAVNLFYWLLKPVRNDIFGHSCQFLRKISGCFVAKRSAMFTS